MADEDRAQEVELRAWEQNNNRPVKPVRFAPGQPGYGPELCENDHCGVAMPEQRRAWGFLICVDCQTTIEQRQARLR